MLDDPFREAFALRIASGKKRREAYWEARMLVGLPQITRASGDVQICRLLRNQEVMRRVYELKGEFPEALIEKTRELVELHARIEKAELLKNDKRAWVINELVDNVKTAKKNDNLQAANKALELLGRELGMFATVIKATLDSKDDLERYSDKELLEIIKGSASGSAPPDDKEKLN